MMQETVIIMNWETFLLTFVLIFCMGIIGGFAIYGAVSHVIKEYKKAQKK